MRFQQGSGHSRFHGEGWVNVLAKVGPALLPLLTEALKQPASELSSYLGEKVKRLLGRGLTHKEVNQLIGMIKQQKGSGTRLPGEGVNLAGGTTQSRFVTPDVGMAQTGSGLLLPGESRHSARSSKKK